MDTRPEARGGLGTVRNAVLLLELLAEGQSYQPLSDLAERSGLSLPTTHRLLRSLALADLVSQDPRSSRYGLGPELTRLSNRYLDRLPVLGALGPYLVQLRDTLATTIQVQIMVKGSVIAIDQVDGSESGPYRRTHSVVPVLEAAAGRILASRSDDEQWTSIVAESPEELRGPALDSRPDWAAAAWLWLPGNGARSGEVAVPLLTGEGNAEGALVALFPPGASVDVEAIAGHLNRAAESAMRSVTHG